MEMVGQSISGTTPYVPVSTGGRPVILPTRVSHLVSAYELALTCVSVMSLSSHAPHVLPVPATQINSLRPLYKWDVQTHPNEEVDHCWLYNAPVMTPAWFYVFGYRE